MDVAISSRSLVTDNMAQALGKLESKARREVVVTLSGGCVPWFDIELLKGTGANLSLLDAQHDFVCAFNWLVASGRRPRVDYIEAPEPIGAPSREALEERTWNLAQVSRNATRERAHAFFEEHAHRTEEGRWHLDVDHVNVWTCLRWKPLSN